MSIRSRSVGLRALLCLCSSLAGVGACSVEGHLYLSPLKNEGAVIGVVADFLTENDVKDEDYSLSFASTSPLLLDGKSATTGCVGVGSKARVSLLAAAGQFDATTRVTVTARKGKCDASGEYLDDAYWPSPGTVLPDIPDAGGVSGAGGGAGTGGLTGEAGEAGTAGIVSEAGAESELAGAGGA